MIGKGGPGGGAAGGKGGESSILPDVGASPEAGNMLPDVGSILPDVGQLLPGVTNIIPGGGGPEGCCLGSGGCCGCALVAGLFLLLPMGLTLCSSMMGGGSTFNLPSSSGEQETDEEGNIVER